MSEWQKSEWQKCPVCEGSGLVPYGFYGYEKWAGGTSSYFSPETCRCCQGKGIIMKPEIAKIEVISNE